MSKIDLNLYLSLISSYLKPNITFIFDYKYFQSVTNLLSSMFKPSCYVLGTISGRASFVDHFLLFVLVCHTVLSVSCSHLVTCWERDGFLTLLYFMFSCVFCFHFLIIVPLVMCVFDCINSWSLLFSLSLYISTIMCYLILLACM